MNVARLLTILLIAVLLASCDSSSDKIESSVYSAVVVDVEIVRTVDGVPVPVEVPPTAANLIKGP